MKNVNRKSTTPAKYPRSKRNHPVMHLSSTMPGVAHPIAFIPMLREDALIGQIDHMIEMLETKELLMNRVTARFTSWLVPFLAFERFKGSRDEFDLSYMGEASLDGSGVTDFMETTALPTGGTAAVPLYLAAGFHGKATDQVNTANVEAYNLIYNHRATNLSKDLAHRLMTDTSLAPAFWNHSQFPHMVPDFDQAMIDGKVALDVVNAYLPIKGLGSASTSGWQGPAPGMRVTGADEAVTFSLGKPLNGAGGANEVWIEHDPANPGYPAVFAEMQSAAISLSLSGIEEAVRVRKLASIRKAFEGHGEEYIIDMLMQGLSVPDQHLKQPIQLTDQTVVFSQGKRYATDSGNLDDSATSGFARASTRLRVPRINTGGVVVVLMEIVPEQVWERQQDWFLHTRASAGRPGHDYWPDAERDTIDREKVDVVYNRDVDTAHTDPTGYFAFEPMNGKYNRAPPTIGGKFHRPSADTLTDDARQRLWTVEGTDPAYTTSFLIVEPGTMHIKPFLDQVNDPFEIASRGNCVIDGNTQFGGLLIEATGNYDAVAANAPTEQIIKE